ncbi:MAG TPA: 16S rRNA (guanine(527)-N(7))-methyltransferase RsmG [Solirubrobacteraceae bacterium]|jgi:16S rRNA (guanine527-N7)-methyltransferase
MTSDEPPPAGETGGELLSGTQSRRLGLLLDVLERDDHAPTTVRARDQAARVHVADSLAALELDPVRAAERIADIGSGAGLPGAVLALALPSAEVALVESQRRRCEFLARLCAAAEIENARVVCARVEEWPQGHSLQDLVVARAVGPQPVVLEYAAPLLRLGGFLVDWRGRRSRGEEEAALRAAATLGLQLVEIRRVEPFEGARDLHLHLFEKLADTPERFPRRPGMARKRPLGS